MGFRRFLGKARNECGGRGKNGVVVGGRGEREGAREGE